MMSTQLYNDATNPAHHKYAAHQVALLYVSVDGTTARTARGQLHKIHVVDGWMDGWERGRDSTS